MDQIVGRLETAVARVTGGGGDDGDVPLTVSEYDAFYKDSVQPFIDACNAVEGGSKLGAWTETAFKHARNFFEAATQCKKPADMMAFLGPIVTVITEAGNVDNRSKTFPEDKSFAEAIQCLNCLIADGPKAVCNGALETADFYLNKTLTAARDKGDEAKAAARAYVKTLKELLKNLGEYCHQNHKTGVVWKFAGVDISEYKPGQAAAAPSGGAGGSVEGRLEALAVALEAYHAKMAGGDDGDEPASVAAFNDFYKDGVTPFVDACKALPELAAIAASTEKAFTHLGQVIKATTQCKKPSPEAYMKFLTPIVEVITEAGNIDNRSAVFNHLKSYSETVQALNFVCMDGAPKGYIMGQIEAGSFYTNKVLVKAKDLDDPAKTNHRDWVKTMKAMLTALAEYAHEYFKMGLVWKVKDAIGISDFGGSAPAAKPAVAPAAAKPAAAAAPAAAAVAAAAAAPKKKKKVFGGAVKKAVGPTEGKIDTSKTDKIFVDNYDGRLQKEPVVVNLPKSDKPTTGVFIDKCKGPNLAIMIDGKVKNVTINNCSDVGIIFDACVTTVEVIGCKKVQIQAKDQAGSYVIDKSDRTTLYLADKSIKEKVVVVSCMSTATNVAYSTEDGEDMVEHGIPDQIESKFKIGDKPAHAVVIPDAE